jgi:hypothetical protein
LKGKTVDHKQKIDFLGGQVAALEAFAIACIRAHPDLASLHSEFIRLNALQEAVSLPTPVSEEYLQGRSATANALQSVVGAALQNKPSA